MPDYVIVGRIRRPHGIRGEVLVEPITDRPAAVFAAGRRVFAGTVEGDLAPGPAALHVTAARPFRTSLLLLRFDGIRDRTDAEQWRGCYVLIPEREAEPPGEGAVFQHELLGMHVESPSGEAVGEVVDLLELPHGVALEVRRQGRVVVLPFGAPFLQEVDRERGRIILDLPVGLLE